MGTILDGTTDKIKNGAYCVGINDNGDREWRVASSYLLGMDVLCLPIERQTNANTKRLADVMRTLGWTKPTQTIRVGNIPCRGFTKTIAELKTDEPKAISEIAKPNTVVELKPKRAVLGLLPI